MGLMYFLSTMYKQGYPPKAQWGVDDMPDLTGRVVIVTGGYAGIGAEMVKALLNHNGKVYIAGRDRAKATKAIAALKEATGREALFLHVDLASLQSIKSAAVEFSTKESTLHVLLNNAGVMNPPIKALTEDGYDLQWGTNVLGPFYLSQLLLPLLTEGVKTSPDGHARIVHTASSTSEGGSIKMDMFRDGPARKQLGGIRLYAQSKLGNIFVSAEMARRFEAQNLKVISCALNPGNIQSDLARHTNSIVALLMKWFIWHPTAMGAITALWAGTADEGVRLNGKYLWPWARIGPPPKIAEDTNLQEQVWSWLEEQVKAFEGSV